MTRRNSLKSRTTCFDAHAVTDNRGRTRLTCHVCHYQMDPLRDRWHADHVIPLATGGQDTAENLKPICVTCHAEKSGNDWSEIAHGRRARAKHFGIKEKRAWRR